MNEGQISEVFAKTCSVLTQVGGFKNILKHTGCIDYQIDEYWAVAFNPHDGPEMHDGVTLSPMTMHIYYGETPVGVCGPSGGAMMHESEGDFIDVLDSLLLEKSQC